MRREERRMRGGEEEGRKRRKGRNEIIMLLVIIFEEAIYIFIDINPKQIENYILSVYMMRMFPFFCVIELKKS